MTTTTNENLSLTDNTDAQEKNKPNKQPGVAAAAVDNQSSSVPQPMQATLSYNDPLMPSELHTNLPDVGFGNSGDRAVSKFVPLNERTTAANHAEQPAGGEPKTANFSDDQRQVLDSFNKAIDNPEHAQRYLREAAKTLKGMGYDLGNPLANARGMNGEQIEDKIHQLGLDDKEQTKDGPVDFLSYYGRLMSHDLQINGGQGDAGRGNIFQQIAADGRSARNGQLSTFAPDEKQAQWLMQAMAWSLEKDDSGRYHVGGGAEKDIGLGLTFGRAAGGTDMFRELNRQDNFGRVGHDVADRFAPDPRKPGGMDQLSLTSGLSKQELLVDAVAGHAMINGGRLGNAEVRKFLNEADDFSKDPIDAGLLMSSPAGAEWAHDVANSADPAASMLNSFLDVNAAALGDPGLLAYGVSRQNEYDGGFEQGSEEEYGQGGGGHGGTNINVNGEENHIDINDQFGNHISVDGAQGTQIDVRADGSTHIGVDKDGDGVADVNINIGRNGGETGGGEAPPEIYGGGGEGGGAGGGEGEGGGGGEKGGGGDLGHGEHATAEEIAALNKLLDFKDGTDPNVNARIMQALDNLPASTVRALLLDGAPIVVVPGGPQDGAAGYFDSTQNRVVIFEGTGMEAETAVHEAFHVQDAVANIVGGFVDGGNGQAIDIAQTDIANMTPEQRARLRELEPSIGDDAPIIAGGGAQVGLGDIGAEIFSGMEGADDTGLPAELMELFPELTDYIRSRTA